MQLVEHGVDRLAVGGRKDDHDPTAPQPAEKERQHLQRKERKQRGGSGHDIHMSSGRKSDSRRGPQTGRRRKSPHQLPVNDDRAGPDETDAADHLRRDAAGVETQPVVGRQKILESVLRDNHNQRAAQRHQEMSAETRILNPVFPVEADDRSAKARHTQSQYQIPLHLHSSAVLFPIKYSTNYRDGQTGCRRAYMPERPDGTTGRHGEAFRTERTPLAPGNVFRSKRGEFSVSRLQSAEIFVSLQAMFN